MRLRGAKGGCTQPAENSYVSSVSALFACVLQHGIKAFSFFFSIVILTISSLFILNFSKVLYEIYFVQLRTFTEDEKIYKNKQKKNPEINQK
jgi:hypothetical protein